MGLTRRSSPACIAHTTQIPYHRPRQNRRRMRRGWVCCTRRRSSAGVSGALARMRLSVPATDPRDIHACLEIYDLCRTAGRSDIGSVRGRAHDKKGANSEHRWEPSPSRTVDANFGCYCNCRRTSSQSSISSSPDSVPCFHSNVLDTNRTVVSHEMSAREYYWRLRIIV